MPPIYMHMAMARDVQGRFAAQPPETFAGEYYLGASAPDIRVITRWERERTHFFDLANMEHQDSVARMFSEYPALRDADRLNPETVAFIAGYIGHLTLDERWITDIYRPHFGQLSALGGDAQANVMDRILQYELERRRREDVVEANAIRDGLAGCSLAIDVGFLDSETLTRWRDVAVDITRYPPTWERFRFQLGRHLRPAGVGSEVDFDAFLTTIPEMLERTIRHVSTAHVDAYLEQAREAAWHTAARYLGVR